MKRDYLRPMRFENIFGYISNLIASIKNISNNHIKSTKLLRFAIVQSTIFLGILWDVCKLEIV